MSEGVVVAGVDAVDGVEGVDCVADSAAKGADCVLVFALGDDAVGGV